jgi:hypothetical protein
LRTIPKYWLDSKFAGLVNQNDQIMAQDFTKRLVNHCNIGLASKAVIEFALHHAEGEFNVRTLVTVLPGAP